MMWSETEAALRRNDEHNTGVGAAGGIGAMLLAVLGGVARHADDVGRGMLRHADDFGRAGFHQVDDFGRSGLGLHQAESEEQQVEIVAYLSVRWDLLADAAKGPLVWKAIARQMGPQALRMNLNTLWRHRVFCEDHVFSGTKRTVGKAIAEAIGIGRSKDDMVDYVAERLARYGGGGMDCSIPLREANRQYQDRRFAGAVLVSDNESWAGTGRYGSTGVMTEWQTFVKNQLRLGGHDFVAPKLVCIDIQPYGNTQAPERPDILNIGGFSDAVFNVVSSFLSNDANRLVSEVEAVELEKFANVET